MSKKFTERKPIKGMLPTPTASESHHGHGGTWSTTGINLENIAQERGKLPKWWDEDAPPVSKQLTLLPEDSLASLTVLPGSEKAQQMTATSGLNISELLKNSSHDTFLARTFLELSPPISTRCYLTWKVKRTPAQRLIFQLWPSMLRIDESGSSLLPTASAWDGKRGPAREYNPKSKSQKDRNLNTFARVHPMAGMWPTPSAQSAGEGELLEKATDKEGNPPKQNERVYNPDTGKHIQVTLNRAVKMWPTPQAGANNPAAHNAMSGDFKTRFAERAGIEVTGQLNPEFVEWLQGFPLHWTEL